MLCFKGGRIGGQWFVLDTLVPFKILFFEVFTQPREYYQTSWWVALISIYMPPFFFKQVGFAFPKKQCHRVPQSAAVQGRGFKTIRFQNPKRNANLSLNIIEINVIIMILILKALFGATTNSSANQKLADKLQNRKEHQWWHRADAAAWDVEGQRLKK